MEPAGAREIERETEREIERETEREMETEVKIAGDGCVGGAGVLRHRHVRGLAKHLLAKHLKGRSRWVQNVRIARSVVCVRQGVIRHIRGLAKQLNGRSRRVLIAGADCGC